MTINKKLNSASPTKLLSLFVALVATTGCTVAYLIYVGSSPVLRSIESGNSFRRHDQSLLAWDIPSIPIVGTEPLHCADANSNSSFGFRRHLTEAQLDDFFNVRSQLDGSFGTADAELLMPYLEVIWRSYKGRRRLASQRVGGSVDVGANVGSVSDMILRRFSNHDSKFYLHHLAASEPKLEDKVHSLYNHESMPFLLAVEGSPSTLTLLQRRAEANQWRLSNFKVVGVAAGNSTGMANFCYGNGGSEQSGLAASGTTGLAKQDGDQKCDQVPIARLVDIVDEHAGRDAEIFLLKVDAEGFDGLVLAGARPLFERKRVQYLIFENHAKWHTAPDVPGYTKQRVGAVVSDLHSLGYACWYVHPWGLIHFPVPGTPEGDRPFEEPCQQGVGRCARHRLYDRGFWSNVLCSLDGDTDVQMRWLADAMLPLDQDAASLMKRP